MKFLGQRVWYSDGLVTTDPWEDIPEDGVLVRILYYEQGKQIQQGMDYYYEAKHYSGEIIRGTGMQLDDIENRYIDAVIKRGIWSPDEYYKGIVAEAMESTYDG